MAPFSNSISFLFLTTLLSLSLQINARDSQFFSKVTRVYNNNNKVTEKTEHANKDGPVNKPEQQQPVFIPETEKNSYGLYGHESGLHPPTTTTTTSAAATTTSASPYTTTTTYQQYKESYEDTSKYPNNNYYNNYNKDVYSTNQNEVSNTRYNNYYNKDAYGVRQSELGDTKYTEGGYKSMANQNNNHKFYYNSNNAANDMYFSNNNNNAANNRYNGERQGISDTRFLEGGKYFYDVNSEKYNPAPILYDGDSSSRGVNSENWNNYRGYFGNNNNAIYYKGYQNQNQQKFEDEQEEFEP